MALVNHAKMEINAKIVYFGPPGSGKSTALEYIFSRIKPSLRGEIKNVPAGGDKLLFFDFSPFDRPLNDAYRLRLHVYTLTGPVTNQETWKMTLKGADGIMIMVDASRERFSEVQESIARLRGFLSTYGVRLHDTSAVLQLNRFEREQVVMDVEHLLSGMDLKGLPFCYSCADRGEGLLEALTTLSRFVLERLAEKGMKWQARIARYA
jgi:signal recognition particle receptor subunit beta